VLRLRCTNDHPDEPDLHIAIDVRLPAPPGLVGSLPLRCVCGAALVALPRAWSIWDPVPRDADGREVED
jgi:hypothetical protein